LTPRARLRLARLIVDEGWPVVRAAERYDVSWPTANRWARRYAELGEAGMVDRSSRPHRQPNRTPQPVVRKIVHLRWKQRLGPVGIADRVGCSASTVHAVLVRCRLNRLSHLDRVTGEPIRRYEHDHPGSLLHVDVKKLGNVPDGGGWRYVGRRQGNRNRAATPDKPRNRHHNPKIGTAFVHTVLDDHSRVAYAEIHDDETAATAAGVLRRAVAWFADRGVVVERVLSDKRIVLPVVSVARRLPRAAHHPQADPALPAPDQRQDRAVPPNPRPGMGLQTLLRHRKRPPKGPAIMDPRVQPPPAPHCHRQGHPYQPLNQPHRSVQLADGYGRLLGGDQLADHRVPR
jgi:hypothetical protein